MSAQYVVSDNGKSKIRIPRLPNFLTVHVGDREETFPVNAFTDEELRAIGEKWTEHLLEHAKKQGTAQEGT